MRAARGMTLLETLVTLVIVAMVAGLLSEGLFQVARIEQRLGGAQLQAQIERLMMGTAGLALAHAGYIMFSDSTARSQ